MAANTGYNGHTITAYNKYNTILSDNGRYLYAIGTVMN